MNALQALGVALGSLGMALFSCGPAVAHNSLLEIRAAACELTEVDWQGYGASALRALARKDEIDKLLREERADIPDRHIHDRARL
jgi:hypothetical protein